jgi:ACS family hexuronate transporter-like MFS transporter
MVRLLRFRQTWAFVLGKFLTDPVWWFYLFWLPAFLKAQYGLAGTDIALPVALVYTMATVGSVLGGYLPLHFIKKGWPVFRARKTSMLIYAFFVVPVIFAQLLGSVNMWLAVGIIGLGRSGAPGMVRQIFLPPFPICFQKNSRVCNRYWWYGRRHRGHTDCAACGQGVRSLQSSGRH